MRPSIPIHHETQPCRFRGEAPPVRNAAYRTVSNGLLERPAWTTIPKHSIIDLPLDILRLVFDYLDDPLGDYCSDGLRDIGNTRLVCRAFNETASPFLFRTLRVSLDEKSLDFAAKVSLNPLFANGVRNIMIRLAYRPKELAADLPTFAKSRLEKLDELSGACHLMIARYRMMGGPRVSDTKACSLIRQCEDAVNEAYYLSRAWQSVATPAARESPDILADKRYTAGLSLIREGHNRYKLERERQRRLIEEGTFSQCMVEIMKRLPKNIGLVFDDSCAPSPNPWTSLTDTTNIAEMVIQPDRWESIESLERVAPGPMLPAKIFWQLPIELRAAGLPLKRLHISCFPSRGDLSVLSPSSDSGLYALREAYSQLEEIKFGEKFKSWNRQNDQAFRLQDQVEVHLNAFLGAVLSSPRLRYADINLCGFGLAEGVNVFYPADTLVDAIQSRILKQIRLGDVSLSANRLEKLWSLLDKGLSKLVLSSIYLDSENWCGTRDLVIKRFSSCYLNSQCYLCFEKLATGAYGVFDLEIMRDPRVQTSKRFVSENLIIDANDDVLHTREH